MHEIRKMCLTAGFLTGAVSKSMTRDPSKAVIPNGFEAQALKLFQWDMVVP